ncbi:Inner membrane protein YqjA [Leminorella grimontii]|nr:Inner membrane protein YqjA [Leminorella grimontii]
MAKIPAHYHQRAHNLFHQHGFFALLIGRFLAFVRTLLPTIAGLSALDGKRFQIFNWLSAVSVGWRSDEYWLSDKPNALL